MKYGKCDDCYFYVESSAGDEIVGLCKRYPPKASKLDDHLLPVTHPESFCGEFHPFNGEHSS